MQYQPDIHTISRSAPPSYAEATGQSVPTGDNQYVPRSGQSTYEHGCTQTSNNPPYNPTYQQPDNFYSNISGQPSYNPPYVVGQENQPTVHHVHCRRKSERYVNCNKKVVIYLVSIIILILLIKLVVFPFI